MLLFTLFLSYFLPFGLTAFQFLCKIQTLLENIYQFKTTETSTLIILQVLLEIFLDSVYRVTVDVVFKCYRNSCCRNIYLSDDVW